MGIYFISPTEASVRRLIFDFGSQAMHSVAHVFFSSPAPPALVAEIRSVPNLVARLRSLKEVKLAVLPIGVRGKDGGLLENILKCMVLSPGF